MSKKDNGGQIVIDESIVERILSFCEKGMNNMIEKGSDNKASKEHELAFIKEELKRVEDEMKKTDILDNKYTELIRVYDKLTDVIQFW